jgi:hypothetical protein
LCACFSRVLRLLHPQQLHKIYRTLLQQHQNP